VALGLHRRGITRVRPLAGGLRAWRLRGFPVEAREAPAVPAALGRAPVGRGPDLSPR
jgi:3-mercaptopyruvate sulfurtransferase SseA